MCEPRGIFIKLVDLRYELPRLRHVAYLGSWGITDEQAAQNLTLKVHASFQGDLLKRYRFVSKRLIGVTSLLGCTAGAVSILVESR